MRNRAVYKSKIEQQIGKSNILWFGVRGDDAVPLLALSQFKASFSFVAPLSDHQLEQQTCLESLTHRRVDLNSYDAGDDTSHEFDSLYRQFLSACKKESILVSYSSWPILTAACFTRANSLRFLGLLHDHRNRFENRAWVETELRKNGIPVVPWVYMSNYDDILLKQALKTSEQIIRYNRSSGGTGFTVINNETDIPNLTASDNRLFAFAPYLLPNIPLNINGCVFPSGDISLHGPSLQLVGIECCTKKPLGYCGNDFARISEIDKNTLAEMEKIAVNTGRWLHSQGYIGAFGLDMILYNGKLLLSEINPRFQGSSMLAANLDEKMDRVDVFLAHIGAFLGLDAPLFTHVHDLAINQDKVSQLYCFNEFGYSVQGISTLPNLPLDVVLAIVPASNVVVEKGGTLFKLITMSSITETGLSLDTKYQRTVEDISKEMFSRA